MLADGAGLKSAENDLGLTLKSEFERQDALG